MKLPSGREVEVSDLTYGQLIELRGRVGESDADFQRAAIKAIAPNVSLVKIDRTDLLALAKMATGIVAGRPQESEVQFREQIAAGLGGNPVGDAIALSQLMAYRWCELLGWSYQEVADTPFDVLPLCLKFRWTRKQLMSTPAQVVHDFLVIFNYEGEMAKSKNGS